MWCGYDLRTWIRLLKKNRVGTSLFRFWIIPGIITFSAFLQSCLHPVRKVKIRKSKPPQIHPQPIFILGHWRSGTTYLHNLLSLDPRHAFPSTYACFNPHSFLWTENRLKKLFSKLPKTRRPMDSAEMGLCEPQEDEFALCVLGLPSIYRSFLFPQTVPPDLSLFDWEQFSNEDREQFKKTFLSFLQQLSFGHSRRFIFKSPTHSIRIPMLLSLFPEARFIVMIRNPYEVYLSTLKMWKALSLHLGLQKPSFDHLENYVLKNYVFLHEKMTRDLSMIPQNHFFECRYERFLKDPVQEVESIYSGLGLESFEPIRSHVVSYVQKQTASTPVPPIISDDVRRRVDPHWKGIIQSYGYS